MRLEALVAHLDAMFDTANFHDFPGAFNGLQVEGPHEVEKVALAVDACRFTIEQTAASGADLLIVHHGLMWAAGKPLVGPSYRRFKPLFDNTIALYGMHLPLDAHPVVGNNANLIRRMGLEPGEMFFEHAGRMIGYTATCDLSRDACIERVAAAIGSDLKVMPFGPDQIRKVGVVTGGAGGHIAEAVKAGVDLYITGEGAHHTYFDAEEFGINVIYGGHYATEMVGIKALGHYIRTELGLETVTIDHPTGL